METVSIVMATYNGAEYLEEQLDSILANDFEDWVLYINDDGSTDRTLSILETYERRYRQKIRVHLNERTLGVTVNFLEGVMRTGGKYVMFCDQDDVWMPDKISKTLQVIKNREAEVGDKLPLAVFTDAKLIDGVMRDMGDSFFRYTGLNPKKTDLAHLLIENKLIGCTMMFNRAVLDKMEHFPVHARYHDWWIGLIAAAFGEVLYLAEPTMQYRQHAKNVVGGQNFLKYVISRVKNLKAQKESIIEDERQAFEFYAIYKEQLLEEQGQVIREFASLHSLNWFHRRDVLMRHGYWKSGLLRNIGVFFLI